MKKCNGFSPLLRQTSLIALGFTPGCYANIIFSTCLGFQKAGKYWWEKNNVERETPWRTKLEELSWGPEIQLF